MKRVIRWTGIPFLRATTAWDSSWASTEAKKRAAPMRPRTAAAPPETRGTPVAKPWPSSQAIRTAKTNHDGSRAISTPRTLPSRTPRRNSIPAPSARAGPPRPSHQHTRAAGQRPRNVCFRRIARDLEYWLGWLAKRCPGRTSPRAQAPFPCLARFSFRTSRPTGLRPARTPGPLLPAPERPALLPDPAREPGCLVERLLLDQSSRIGRHRRRQGRCLAQELVLRDRSLGHGDVPG